MSEREHEGAAVSGPADAGPVGVVGLGAMGRPMAECLSAAGLCPWGFDVASGSAARAAQGGVQVAPTVTDLAEHCELLICMVRDLSQIESVLHEHGLLTPRHTVVVSATIGRTAMARLAEAVAPTGAALVDAPVSGGALRAASGELVTMVSGPPDAVGRARPVLDVLSATVAPCGDRVGQAQQVKVVNQLLCGVHIVAAAEALALAKAADLDLATVMDVLTHGAAASFMLGDRGPRMLEPDPEIRSALAIFVKDMGLVAQECQAIGLAAPVAGSAGAAFVAAAARGWGDIDDSQVIRVYTHTDAGTPKGEA